MNARILLFVGALALGVVALLWFLRRDEGASPRGAAPAEERPPAAQPGELEGSAELDAVQAPSEPAQEREEARRASEEESRPTRTWAAEDTRWVELRLIAPAGTPAEEQAEVVALEKGGDYASLYGKDGPVAALRARKPGADVPGVLAVAAFERDGTARIGLPPDAEQAWLLVAGHYLYSLEPRQVELAAPGGAELVELRPILGARISGRLLAPAGSPAGAVAGVELELDWSINAVLQLGASGREELELETASDGDGHFEFRAVPVGKPQTLTTRSSLARLFSEDLAPVAGEHLRLELALFAGGAVQGRVVDDGGAPLAGCEVEALGREFFGNPTAELRSTESDAEGRFALGGLTPGKVWLHVEHADHQELLTPPFELGDGESRDHGDIVLSEGLVVSGSVAFPDGAPAAGTLVSVQPDLSENLAGSPVDPRAYIGDSNKDAADERGAFRITGLGAGPWIVAAELELEDAEGARAVGRWSASQGLVRPPATDVRLTLEPPVTVSGTVLDGQRRPVAKFSVHAQRAGSQWYMPPSETKEQSFESADGRFLVTGLRSGSWSFQATAEGYAKSEKVALELPVEEGADVKDTELALVLLRPVQVAGTVVDPDGLPVAGAEVTKELEGTEAILAMQGRSDWPVAQSDDEGAFRLEGVAPGASSIFAKKDGFAPSEGLSLELAEGEQKLDLVLRLRRGGTISGEVYGSDGKPASGSMVILQMPTLEQRRFASTDARGTFSESSLKPGLWQVQAFPGIESLQSESGEPLDQAKLLAALKMTSVTLDDGQEEHVVLGAPPEDPVRVHGRVTLDGEPVPGAMISFVPADGAGLDKLKIETTDGEGRYELQLDAPGDHLVTVQSTSAPGRQNSIEFRRTVPKGEETRLDLELPLGRISGRVEDSHGEAVSGARVTVTMQGGLVFGTVFGGNYTEAATDATGAYEIPWLRPGSYTVAAGGAFLGGAFGEGAALGREVKSVELREGESVRGVDFRLEQPGSVHGTVRDAAGNLVAEASIFLRDEEGRLIELFSLASTNASGTFEYPGLAPGDYVVTARTRTLASAAGVPVRVRSDESSEVTLVLQPGTVLLVSLEDASGADIPSRVSVLDDKGRELNGMLGLAELMERYSGGLGGAVQRVGPLPAGTYEVRAIAEDGRSAQRSVSLTGQAERKLKLRLR